MTQLNDLADLSGAPDANLIEGHTLAPMRVREFGALQRHFEAVFLRVAILAGETLPKPVADKLTDQAMAFVASGKFRYGTEGFDGAALSIDQLPVMLWAALQTNHPKMTPASAGLLITEENRANVYEICLDMAGYRRKKKEVTPPTTQSTGPGSLKPSDPAGSTGMQSST